MAQQLIQYPTGPRAASIMDLPNTVWRDTLVPAAFNGAQFHCEQYTVESGRRLIEHEFPKRDMPDCEDMGHRALTWEVRGYIIVYPFNVNNSDLYQRDYRIGRDALVREVGKGRPVHVAGSDAAGLQGCSGERYRLTVEHGAPSAAMPLSI